MIYNIITVRSDLTVAERPRFIFKSISRKTESLLSPVQYRITRDISEIM